MRRHPKASAAGSIAKRRIGNLGLLAAVCVLLVVPSAQASLGVDTYWGSPDGAFYVGPEGGRFNSNGPRGVAIYGATGDVYVADSGNNRIQQFDEDGGFIRAWGFDVDGSNPSTGFEICAVKANCKQGINTVSPAPGGEFSNPSGITVDQGNGHLYVSDVGFNRVQEFTSAGVFVRAFGQDVVTGSGGENAPAQPAKQTLTVDATEGQFKLSFQGQTTGDLAFNAPATGAGSVQTALQGLSSIGAGNATVTGGPGGSAPYVITFAGALNNSPQPLIGTTAGTTPLAGGTATATVTSSQTGSSGFEVCAAAVNCKAGVTGATAGAFGTGMGYPAMVPTGGSAPNAGNLLVADPGNRRVQEFTAAGSFVRAFGWDTVSAGPSNKNFASGPDRADEVQSLIVRATAGKFRLNFGAGGIGISQTAELDFNASALEVQNALNALTNISTGGGSVSVSGGPGDANGSSPYVVTFDGGPRAGADVAQITGTNVNLSGGIAASAVLAFTISNGNQGFEVCRAASFDVCKAGSAGADGKGQFANSAPTRVAEDLTGNIYTVESVGTATGTPRVRTSGFRVQRFTLPGNTPTPQGTFACGLLCGSGSDAIFRHIPTEVAIDGQGLVYVGKALLEGEGTPPVPPTLSSAQWQDRVLKVDSAGTLVETINANTGSEPGVEGDTTLDAQIAGISGIAVTPSGSRLYAATAFNPVGTRGRSRIYRFGEISGPSGSVTTAAVGATAATLTGTVFPAETLQHVKTFYYFEYRREGTTAWLRSPSTDINIGNGSAGGESTSCSPQLEAATCQVSGEIDNLELGRTYQYRLVARTSYRGALFTTAPQEFTTSAVPPSVTTGSAVWSGPPSTSPSLTFTGSINPQGADTSYVFEYVTEPEFQASGFATAHLAPVAPISAGHGTRTLDVSVVKGGLDASSRYRFRLVATNPTGATVGSAGSVAASHAGDRFVELVSAGDSQGADVRPDVTVSDDGRRAAFTALTFGEDQQAAPWIVTPAIAERGVDAWRARAMAGDPDSPVISSSDVAGGVGNAEVTQRLWGTRPAPQTVQWAVRKLDDGTLAPVSPVISPLDRTGSFALNFLGGSADLSALVLQDGFEQGGATLFPDEPLLSAKPSNLYKVSGAGTGSPSLSLLNRADGGGTIGGACGAVLGSGAGEVRTGAVSADGAVVYFSARAGNSPVGSCGSSGIGSTTSGSNEITVFTGSFTAGQAVSGEGIPAGATIVSVGSGKITVSAPATATGISNLQAGFPLRIFKRVGDSSAIEVSACAKTPPGSCSGGDDSYWGASADGTKVFFSTARQLTDSDSDSSTDLFLYDSSPPAGQPNLVRASAGEQAADVQGVVDFAMDGSRVYFVAKGRLTPEASTGANNLYVFQRDDAKPAGRIAFIASLAGGIPQGGIKTDPRLWIDSSNSIGRGKPAYALPRYDLAGGSRSDGDGHLLLFVSNQPLLPTEDQDSANDVYRYDDVTGHLACPSCAGDGEEPVSIIGRNVSSALPDQIQRERVASEDGSKVAFVTAEALLPEDANAVEDVYLWEDGTLSLVSGATAETGVSYSEEGGGPAVSPDGSTVFFATRATLLPQDRDNGARDIYAARLDGGFSQEETSVACSSEAACRVVDTADPPQASTPASATFAGAGNVRVRCAKKRILRGGRCVKRKPRRHRKHKSSKHRAGQGKKQNRAGSGRRAGR